MASAATKINYWGLYVMRGLLHGGSCIKNKEGFGRSYCLYIGNVIAGCIWQEDLNTWVLSVSSLMREHNNYIQRCNSLASAFNMASRYTLNQLAILMDTKAKTTKRQLNRV